MKIYLASYLQPENWGTGRKIAIEYNKNKDVPVDFVWESVIPSEDLSSNYIKFKFEKGAEYAGKYFEEQYSKDLNFFKRTLIEEAKEANKSVQEILGLEDGDTLLSWERFEYSNYRHTVKILLEDLGYEVVWH